MARQTSVEWEAEMAEGEKLARLEAEIERLRADLLEADTIIRRMDDDESWLWPDDLREAVSRSLGRTLEQLAATPHKVDDSCPECSGMGGRPAQFGYDVCQKCAGTGRRR